MWALSVVLNRSMISTAFASDGRQLPYLQQQYLQLEQQRNLQTLIPHFHSRF
jgi:hypothetical protein